MVINPSVGRGEELCRVSEGDAADVDLAVKAAKAAFALVHLYNASNISISGSKDLTIY